MARRAVATGAVCLLLLVAGCGSDDSDDTGTIAKQDTSERQLAGPNQSITVASGAEPAGLDPQKQPDDGMYMVLYPVYEGLVGFDAEGELAPVLAESMPEAVDDTTWEVKLKPDVKFADGTPFNADAAVYSIERITDPKFASAFSETSTIKGVEKVDDSTIRITTKKADPLLPYRLKSIQMLAPDAAEAPGFPTETNGTGPYTLESYDAGSEAVLKYNPEWRGEKPQVTEVKIRFMPDANTRVAALETGEVDLAPSISADQAKNAPGAVQTAGPVVTGMVRINAYKGILADERVRQALNYAVDKEGIAKKLYGGYASPAKCQLTPTSAGNASQELEAYPYDPEKAKALIEEAGAKGKSVEMIWSTGVFPLDRELGEVVAQSFKEVGLDPNIKFLEYNAYLEDLFVVGDKGPEMIFLETDNSIGNASSQANDFYASKGQVSSYGTPELDAKIEAAEVEIDAEEQARKYAEILKEACDKAAVVFLDYRNDIFGKSDRLAYTPHAQVYSKLNFEEMKVVK